MEFSNIPPSCQICLDSLDPPVNLFDSLHANLLNILQQLLAFQIYTPGYDFLVCCNCQGKLKWIIDFQNICLNSLAGRHQINNQYETEFHNVEKQQVIINPEDDHEQPPIINYYRNGPSDHEGNEEFSLLSNLEVRLTRSPVVEHLVVAAIDKHVAETTETNLEAPDYSRLELDNGSQEVENSGGYYPPFDEGPQLHNEECSNRQNEDYNNVYCGNFEENVNNFVAATEFITNEEVVPDVVTMTVPDNNNLNNAENKIVEYSEDRHEKEELSPNTLKKLEKSRDIQQYPKEKVLQAIADCTAYKTELKYRTCLYCNCVVLACRFLLCHMRRLHRKHCKTWCARCNIETEDLKLHLNTTKCSENGCVFCDTLKFKKTNDLIAHLKTHCHELIVQQECCDDIVEPEVNPARTTIILPVPNLDLPSTNISNLSTDNIFFNSPYFSPDEDFAIDGDDLLTVEDANLGTNLDDISSTINPDDELFSTPYFTQHENILMHGDNRMGQGLDNDMIIYELDSNNEAEENVGKNAVKPFPKSIVNDAIAEAINFMTKLKFRKCVICKQSFGENSILSTHMKTKHKETLETWCRYCNIVTEDLKEHCDATKCNERRCNLCLKIYPSYRCLRRHLNLHYHTDDAPKDNPEKTVCTICGNHYKKMSQHMFTTHAHDQRLKCAYCDRRFKYLYLLKCHEKRHTTERSITCEICSKTFIDQREKRSHMRIHEGGPVQCTVCEKVLPRPAVLKLHMKSHTGENKYKCNQCDKSYHRKHLLDRHMVTHSEERPHKCSFCEKRFKVLATLAKHENMHKGFRPFKCTFCDFTAIAGYALTAHMKVHPEDAPLASKPYKCSFCYLSFSTKAVLISHTAYIHGTDGKKRGVEKMAKPNS